MCTSAWIAKTTTVTNIHQSEDFQGCAHFPEFTQNFSERRILWSLCSVDFHTLTLHLPIQTPHSVAPELQVFVSSLENCQNFSKTSTPQWSGSRISQTKGVGVSYLLPAH